MELVLLEKQDQIGTLTLNRPEKLNAMSPDLLGDFSTAIEQLTADRDVKVIIIRGAGRAFSSGYDLGGGGGGNKTVDQDRHVLQGMIERWLRLRDIPKPVIAMVHGYCLAGATQICICSDIIFVAENARIGFPSIPAGAGFVSAMWNWQIGPHRTKYMAFLPGSQMSGKEAEAIGFATRTFPDDQLEEETYAYARRITKVPAEKLRLEKLSINRAMDLQGFRSTVLAGAEYDAIAHFGSASAEVHEVLKERGLKGAIKWYEDQ